MRTLENPVNRLLRCLGMKAVELSAEIGLTHRHFQTLSAKLPPSELTKIIENRLPVKFTEQSKDVSGANMSSEEQRLFVDSLLRNGRQRQDRYGELLLKPRQEIFVLSEDGDKFRINDLRSGTPTSSQGNLLTFEFSRLLKQREEWKIFLREITHKHGVSFVEAWQKCERSFPNGFTADQFIAECAQGDSEIAAKDWNGILRILNPIAEYYLMRSFHARLKALQRKKNALSEKDGREYARYKDEFMDQYDLSPKLFNPSLYQGVIALVDADAENTAKLESKYPRPENLRVALIFVDEAMTAVLQERERKARGKK